MTSIPVELCATFDADEIRRLGKRFKKLDVDGSGSLSVQEFMTIPELQQIHWYNVLLISLIRMEMVKLILKNSSVVFHNLVLKEIKNQN